MDLKRVFEAQSLAVFGVSQKNPFNPTNVIYHKNRLRYNARTYALNPRGGDLYGEQVYKSLADVPEKVDLAVIGVKAELVPSIVEDCIQSGVGGAIVISGGFAETGRKDLQDEVARLSRENHFPVIGPNCLGVFSPPLINTFFLPSERLIEIRPGGITLVSQSGGILVDLMTKLTVEGAGIAKGVSIGNRAAVDEVELLRYFIDDPGTSVMGFYLEGFGEGRGRDFVELMKTTKKPVVFIKSGKTPGGSRAVASHTASVAGDYRVLHEVMAQHGALEARSESEFVAFCQALSTSSRTTSNNVGIVTASGGHGAIASDECFHVGLSTPPIPQEDAEGLRAALSANIQGIASLSNPIDLTGSANDADFVASAKFLFEKDYIGAIIVLLLPYLPAMTSDVSARLSLLAREHKKPLVAYVPRIEKYGMFIEGFEDNGVPVSHSVNGCVHMARALCGRDCHDE